MKRLSVILILIGLALLAVKSFAEEPYVLKRPDCYPILPPVSKKVIDFRLDMKGELDVAIWFCDTSDGLEENYRVGSFGNPCDECFKQDYGLDKIYELDKAAFGRPLKEIEKERLAGVEAKYEPRCEMNTTAATTGVRMKGLDGKIGAVRVDDIGKKVSIRVADAKPSCWDWIRVAPGDATRYCSVTEQLDTLNRLIGPDSYVPCKLIKAPANGWAVP